MPLWAFEDHFGKNTCLKSLGEALAGKRVVASLLGHRRLVALCFLAVSQVSRWGS